MMSSYRLSCVNSYNNFRAIFGLGHFAQFVWSVTLTILCSTISYGERRNAAVSVAKRLKALNSTAGPCSRRILMHAIGTKAGSRSLSVSLISIRHLGCINCIKPSKGVHAYHLLSTETDACTCGRDACLCDPAGAEISNINKSTTVLENSLFRSAYQYYRISNLSLWSNRCNTNGNIRRLENRWYHSCFICTDHIILLVWS